jgi:3-oxoacyl-(acyl-carrier-protein) synthase
MKTQDEQRTFVISGVGLASPAGIGIEDHQDALSGPPAGLAACAIPEFALEDYLPSKKPFLDRHSRVGLLAAALALGEAAIEGQVPRAERSDLLLAAGLGNHGSLAMFRKLISEKGIRLASPMVFPHTYPNTTASLIAIEFGLRGAHLNFCGGPAGAAHAMHAAMDRLCSGEADLALVGGADCPATPDEASSAEAAAFLTLETASSALGRAAEALCALRTVALLPAASPDLLSERLAACAPHTLCLPVCDAADQAAHRAGLPAGPMQRITGRMLSGRLPIAVGLAALALQTGKVPPALAATGQEDDLRDVAVLDVCPPVAVLVHLTQAR